MINTYQLLKTLCDYAPKHNDRAKLNGVHIYRPDETNVIFEASDATTAIRVNLTKHDSALMFLPVGTDVILCANSLAAIDEEGNPPLLIDGRSVWIGSSQVALLEEQYPDIERAMMLQCAAMDSPVYLDLNLVTHVANAMRAIGDGQSVAKFAMRGRNQSALINLEPEDGISVLAVIVPVRKS